MTKRENRLAQARWRRRQKEQGFKQLIVWIRPEDHERIKKYIARLNKKPPAVRGERDD